MGSQATIGVFGAKIRGSGAKIGGSGAKIGGSVAMFEASGVMIGTQRPGLGPLVSISGHLGPRLVALGSRFGARTP